VATRRLRSDLKTFGAILDPAWVDAVRTDLRWAVMAFGEVRDADVLSQRLESQGHRDLTDVDGGGLAALQEGLASERQAANERLLAVLDSDRYLDLLDALSTPPPWRGRHDQPARSATGPLVRRSWKKLAKTVGRLGDPPADTDLHQIRIRAKQLRYGAEAATIVVGAPARKLAAAAAQLQGTLGDHHDAVAAEAWLRRQASTIDAGPGVFVAGELVMVQRREQAELRESWSQVWDGLARKRLRRWLH
jgi:CHAD domain-containing protein